MCSNEIQITSLKILQFDFLNVFKNAFSHNGYAPVVNISDPSSFLSGFAKSQGEDLLQLIQFSVSVSNGTVFVL